MSGLPVNATLQMGLAQHDIGLQGPGSGLSNREFEDCRHAEALCKPAAACRQPGRMCWQFR